MDAGFDKTQIISDYTAFLQALLPETTGFCCYDSRGRRFWHEQPAGEVAFPEQYEAILREVLGVPERAASIGCVSLEQATACIVPLIGDNEHILGALTVLLDSNANLTYESCLNRLQPAVRSLERELTLRYRLVGLYKQLSVRSAEENLLHQVEKTRTPGQALRKDPGTYPVALPAFSVDPRRSPDHPGTAIFACSRGRTVKPVELTLMLSDMTEQAPVETDGSRDTKNIVRFDAESDVLATSVRDDKKRGDRSSGVVRMEKIRF